MVHSVASGAINNWRVGHIFAIMDQYCPDVDKDKQKNVGKLLQWKDEWKDVIWY
jgi:hypothetical protein